MQELKTEEIKYTLNKKTFILQNDFAWGDLEYLDEVSKKLSGNKNEVSGKFTSEEIFKALSIIIKDENGNSLTEDEFKKITVGVQTKILADFFLMKSLQGSFITSLLKLSQTERIMN